MGAGQRISKQYNSMPALACLPINSAWFWKTNLPADSVKNPDMLVNNYIIPFNKVDCNFILNVAPNRDGLIDDNTLTALKTIGKIWKNNGPAPKLPTIDAPIISSNLAKNQPSNSSWSDDMNIMDFANDDDFTTSWISNPTVKSPWYEIDFDKDKGFNTIVIAEQKPNITNYRLEYCINGVWKTLFDGENGKKIKVHRFDRVWGNKVRISIAKADHQVSIAEFQVYNERR